MQPSNPNYLIRIFSASKQGKMMQKNENEAERFHMRQFNYSTIQHDLLTPEIVNLIAAIQEHKGKQILYLSAKPDALNALTEVAKIQSTEASNLIEGIRTSDKRLREIMSDKSDLKSRDEEEIAGYRDVLALIHENHDFIDVTPNVILQLHRMMYKHSAPSVGGHFKIGDNEIRGIDADGNEYVRLLTVPAVATEDAIQRLCRAYQESMQSGAANSLIASILFVFDFTCIHPFNDGNGRMSRLLTLLLLYKLGYLVGKYVSIEKEIERTKGAYYEALSASSAGWLEGTNNPSPFVKYMLGVILAAYKDFEDRVLSVSGVNLTKPQRIEQVLRNSVGKVTKQDISLACPDISTTTIERTLSDLLAHGKINKVGAGRATGYVWVQ